MPKRAKVSECSAEMVYDIVNIQMAHKNARKGKSYYQEVKMVDSNQAKYLYDLQEKIIDGTIRTSEYIKFEKQEGPKLREIFKLPYYPDRIYQWAIIQVIEPILIRNLTRDTYSAIPGRGTYAAYKELKKALKSDYKGTQWCLKIDIRKYYPNINREKLKKVYRHLIKDKGIINMLDEIIDSMPGDKGVPIGNYISQYSGNVYLSEFDHRVKEVYGVKYYYRYMDDMVFLAETKEELQVLLKEIKRWLKEEMDLDVKENWSLFYVEDRGINFVGYIFRHNNIRLRRSIVNTLRKISLKIRRKVNKGQIINFNLYCGINSMCGWLKHCDSGGLRVKYVDIIWDHVEYYHDNVIKFNAKKRRLKKDAGNQGNNSRRAA